MDLEGLSGWLAGWAEAPLGSFWKGIDSMSTLARQAPLRRLRGRRIEDAYGESPPPPAFVDLPFVDAPVWRNVLGRRPTTLNFRRCPLFWAPRSSSGVLRKRLGLSWGHLGQSWGHLGPSWGNLGPSWAVLETPRGHPWPSWVVLGPSWGCRGGAWGRLGAFSGPFCAEKCGRQNNSDFPLFFNDFSRVSRKGFYF